MAIHNIDLTEEVIYKARIAGATIGIPALRKFAAYATEQYAKMILEGKVPLPAKEKETPPA